MTDMLIAKLILAYCAFAVLRQLLTGKAYGGDMRVLKLRLAERPGQRVWWGPTWYYKDEWPKGWWFTLIGNCLLIVGLVLGISGKLPKLPPGKVLEEILDRLPIFAAVGGLVAVSIVWNVCGLIWRPSRSGRKLLGIGSPRTTGLYVAALLSAAVIAVLNRSSRLGLWFFVPYGLLMLGLKSSQIDSGRPG
jgi:hypothetical protein